VLRVNLKVNTVDVLNFDRRDVVLFKRVEFDKLREHVLLEGDAQLEKFSGDVLLDRGVVRLRIELVEGALSSDEDFLGDNASEFRWKLSLLGGAQAPEVDLVEHRELLLGEWLIV